MEKLVDFFSLLSDETRLRIVLLLFDRKLCVCELCGILNESQPKISKHLGKLRDMGIVKDERKEQFMYYNLNITDELYISILKGIIEKVNDYPTLKNDLHRVKSTEIFLNSCRK